MCISLTRVKYYCSGEMQRSTVVFSREGGGSRLEARVSPANLFDPMNSAPRGQRGESGNVSRWGEEGPSAFWPESSRGVHGLLPRWAAPRRTAAYILYPRERSSTQQQHSHQPQATSNKQPQEVLSRGWTESRDVPVCSYSFNKSVSNIPVEDE